MHNGHKRVHVLKYQDFRDLYGDPAYPDRAQLQNTYRHNILTEEQLFNTSMRKVRVSVEWIFG